MELVNPKLTSVGIEINYACNRTCSFCPNSIFPRKDQRFLEEKIFYKIIDNLQEINFDGNITFNLYNEPLLDKRLPRFLKYIKSRIPDSFSYINTNGDALNLENWKLLRESGLDYANISQYDNKNEKNIKKIKENIDKDEKWRFDVHPFDENNADSRVGLVKVKRKVKTPIKKFCVRPFSQMMINYKGQVILCCNDYHSSKVMGDLSNEKIQDVWRSNSFINYRKKLINGNRAALDLCKKCFHIGSPLNFKK